MDAQTLQAAVIGCTARSAVNFAEPITAAMAEFEVDTPVRQAAFLAQVGHESMGLRYTRELWGPTPAQARYEGREDLGNVEFGDGRRYLGRGLIQITGRANYAAAARALGVALLADPKMLEEPGMAATSAAWWWSTHGCNELADGGDFRALTRRINGGLNGLEDREKRWARAKQVLAA